MDVKKLKEEYAKRKPEIIKALQGYKQPKDIFYELCFCILTPQSNAFRCDECVKILEQKDFKNKKINLVNILKKKTRFHNTKANNLTQMKQQFSKIVKQLNSNLAPIQKRDYLVKHVRGLGLKEAAHFLRNIGYENMPILDRHILKLLHKLQVIDELPATLTRNRYEEIAQKFQAFGEEISIPMDQLDLLFWSMQTGKVFK